MYIRKIKIDKFKSFYEPFELDFDQVKGLWKVSGSVGSGKTSIGEAILFSLFGTISGKNNGDLVSWGHEMANLEIWCRSNSREIYIKRKVASSGWSNIYVEIDGEELVFTNKRDAQKQLEEEYFDISRVTMELLCIISFNNFRSLATLNPGETKRFLDQVLGFYTLTQYADVCKQFRHDNDVKMQEINNEILKLTARIDTLNRMSNVQLIEGDLNEVLKEIKEVEDKMNDLKVEYEKSNKEYIKKDSDLKSEQAKLKTLGQAKAKEISFIEKGVCPTCGASIDQSQLETKKAEKEVLLKQYNSLSALISQNNTLMNQNKFKYEDNINPLKEKKNSLRDKSVTLRNQASRQNVNKEEIDKLTLEKIEQEKLYDSYLAEQTSWERLYSVLTNDVRSKILESFIPALNKNIMKYSTELHQPYIVKFDRQFKCSVTLAGYDNEIPLSSLSTGQLKTVDMMIILGVLGTVIGSNSANVIFLDELFSNLDGGLRNDMCSVLHNFIGPNDTMFVISHQDLNEQYFNGTMKLHIDHKGQYEKQSSVIFIENAKE
jgi:DNA repair exonuclease SbcCD ATPase subunit